MHVGFLPILPLYPVVVKLDTKLLALQAILERVLKSTQFSQNLTVVHVICRKRVVIKVSIVIIGTATRGLLYLGLT